MIDTEEEKSKFNRLYNMYQDTVLKAAYYQTKDATLAEDASQEAWLTIASNIGSVRDYNETELKSFLITVAKNKAIDLCRKQRSDAFINLESIKELEAEEDFISKLEGEEAYGFLVHKILDLPIIYQEVLKLRLINNISYKGIAKILSLNINTVKARIKKGRKILKEFIKESEKNGQI